MVFKSTLGTGLTRSLSAASAWGYPGPRGIFAPFGEGDLRPAVYAPASSFTETAAVVLSTLFTEDLDPLAADRLAERAFASPPAIVAVDEAIPIMDLAQGPTGSSADYGAALFVGFLETRPRERRQQLIVALEGAWGAAVAEAASGLAGVRVLLLCGERQTAWVGAGRLARHGGQTRVVGLRGSPGERLAFLRSLAGRQVADYDIAVAGPGNPAELAARIVIHAATFADLRRGSSGEIYAALPAGSSLALASAMWAWGLGLPLTGILVPQSDGARTRQDRVFDDVVQRFKAERSGLLDSIVFYRTTTAAEAVAARDALRGGGGPLLDRGASYALAAAQQFLLPSLRGHSLITLARHALPFWEPAPAWHGDGPPSLVQEQPDATIDASFEDLERLLAAETRD